MRAFISEIHDSTQGAVMAMSGASLALMVIALWGTSSTGLISIAAFAMTACLAWQIGWFARHRVVQLPRRADAATDGVEAHEARDDQSDHRLGKSSRKSGRPTI